MLSVVLLHVIEPAWPVHDAVHLLRVEGPFERVPYGVAVAVHVDHAHAVQRALIRRLPAPLGIERAAVEPHARPALMHITALHAGVEGGEVGIRVVESVSQETLWGFFTPSGPLSQSWTLEMLGRPHWCPFQPSNPSIL